MSTSLPEEIQELVNTALAEVNADPQHRLTPQHRREIYDAFRASADLVGQRACAWLAIFAAQRVLPIFQQEFPEDTLPQDLLDAAIGVLQGRVDDAVANDLQDHGYHASGNAWGYDEGEITWNTELSGGAAYKALVEACGHQPLTDLNKFFKFGSVSWPSGKPLNDLPQSIRGDQFTDEDLCQISDGDAASAAAVAFAGAPDRPLCDSSKLLEFWTWWLTAVISEAWRTAQQ